MSPDPALVWLKAGAVGTIASAGFLCWYTVITNRLMRITKWANEPFVILTMSDFSAQRKAGVIYLRNVGGSPALDIVVSVDTSKVPLGPGVRRPYRCDVLSPNGGQTVLERHVTLEGPTTGQRFLISYRNVAGFRRKAPAGLILDPIQDSCFIWNFPRFPWWKRWLNSKRATKL